MQDEAIVDLYWQKNANAIKETDSKYGIQHPVRSRRQYGECQ